MHGYFMIILETNNKDYFKLGGKSEFFGKSLMNKKKINRIEIFKSHGKNQIVFAPNHTYDLNTFKALKIMGIEIVLDGYGLQPYYKNDLIFIP